MKKLALLCLLPLCGCSSISQLAGGLGQSSYTVTLAPMALGPIAVGQISFTVSPHQAPPK